MVQPQTEEREMFYIRIHLPGWHSPGPSMTFPPNEMPENLTGLKKMVAEFCQVKLDIEGIDASEFNEGSIVFHMRNGHTFEEQNYRDAKKSQYSREEIEVHLMDPSKDRNLRYPEIFQRTPTTHIDRAISYPAKGNIVR